MAIEDGRNHLVTIHQKLKGEAHMRELLGRDLTDEEHFSRKFGFDEKFVRSEHIIDREQLSELDTSINNVRQRVFKEGRPLSQYQDAAYIRENEIVAEEDIDQIYCLQNNEVDASANRRPRDNVYGRLTLETDKDAEGYSISYGFSFIDFVLISLEFPGPSSDKNEFRYRWRGHMSEMTVEEYEIYRFYANAFLNPPPTT